MDDPEGIHGTGEWPECDGCPLYNPGTRHRVCVPPPSDCIRGCIISRDPPSAFLEPLRMYKRSYPGMRGNLLLDAPPRWLCERIQEFTGLGRESPGIRRLAHFLNCECYWTHFHKCPTEGKERKEGAGPGAGRAGFPPYSYETAEKCADAWFRYEFERYQIRNKIVIILGRDIHKYFFTSRRASDLLTGNDVYYFPHPSPANMGNGWSWNMNKPGNDPDRICLENKVNRLLARLQSL
jgi:hypothetical protein